jgi:hypothetical protein
MRRREADSLRRISGSRFAWHGVTLHSASGLFFARAAAVLTSDSAPQ